MRCKNPIQLPAKRVRADASGALLGRSRRAVEEAVHEVPCNYCHPCRMNRSRERFGRLKWEVDRHGGSLGSHFVCVTYRPEDLPHSVGSRPGTLNERQEKLYRRIEKRSKAFTRLSERDAGLLDLMHEATPDIPTVSGHHASLLRKIARKKFPHRDYLQLDALEYGSNTDRPHNHQLWTGLTRDEVEWIISRWKYGEVTDIQTAYDDGVLSYVIKDVIKGSWHRERYLAEGREEPRVIWPRNPYVGQSQEEYIRRVLMLEIARNPLDAEIGIQQRRSGIVYRTGGKRYLFSTTARNKVLQELLEEGIRNQALVDKVAYQLELNRTQEVRKRDETDPMYDPEFVKIYEHERKCAKNASATTIRRHNAILERKRRGGSRTSSKARRW